MSLGSMSAAALGRHLSGWRASAGAAGYRQLAAAIRLLIADGRLPPRTRLPGERDLAPALGVSRTMVSAAYGQLREDGYLVTRQGSGSVAAMPPGSGVSSPSPDAPPVDALEMRSAVLPANGAILAAYEAAVAVLPGWLRHDGYELLGVPALREAIAQDYARRGCPTDPAQIMVTTGAQSAWTLLLRSFAAPGDRVLVDHPTYHHALGAIAAAHCSAVPAPLGPEGWDMPQLAVTLRQSAARLAYVIADFQNPTGHSLDAQGRAALVEAAARAGTRLVVDETMADCWLDRPSPPPVAAFDPAGQSVAIGSLGKRFWGGMRIGWIRASADMIGQLAAARASFDMATPLLEQLVAARLLAGEASGAGWAERREMLLARRARLAEGLRAHLPEWRFTLPAGGLSLWVTLPVPVATALAALAATRGLAIAPGPRFGLGEAFERCLRLPFTLPEEQLDRAVGILAGCWAQLHPAAGGGTVAPLVDAPRVI